MAKFDHYPNNSNNIHSCFNYLGILEEIMGNLSVEEIIKRDALSTERANYLLSFYLSLWKR